MFGGFFMIQVATGFVASDQFCLGIQLLVTMFVSGFIAQYMTETIWNCCAVAIHAVASTVQSVFLGPICFAFDVATNALFAVLEALFKDVKMILLAVFGAIRTALSSLFSWRRRTERTRSMKSVKTKVQITAIMETSLVLMIRIPITTMSPRTKTAASSMGMSLLLLPCDSWLPFTVRAKWTTAATRELLQQMHTTWRLLLLPFRNRTNRS